MHTEITLNNSQGKKFTVNTLPVNTLLIHFYDYWMVGVVKVPLGVAFITFITSNMRAEQASLKRNGSGCGQLRGGKERGVVN